MVWEFGGAMAGNDFGQDFRVHKTPRQIARRALAVGKQFFDFIVIDLMLMLPNVLQS